jgi:hypothetical protein
VTEFKPGMMVQVTPLASFQRRGMSDELELANPAPYTAMVLAVVEGQSQLILTDNPRGFGWEKGYASWVVDACRAAGVPEGQSIRLAFKMQCRVSALHES